MNRRVIYLFAALWTAVLTVLVWEWRALGRCGVWSHRHDLGALTGLMLAAGFLLTLGLAWLSWWRGR